MNINEDGFNKTVLDSSIRLLTKKMPGARSISLCVLIQAGSRDEGEHEQGISHLLEHVLFKGTSKMNARQIAEAFDFIGADINAATAREYTTVYTRVMEEYLDRAVEIIVDMVREPLLDDGDLDSEKKVVLEEINMHLDSPDEIVHDYLSRTMWGNHPLGHSILGRQETISGSSSAILRNFLHDRYVGKRIVVVGAGAVDHDSLAVLISRCFDGIGPGAEALRNDTIEPMKGVYIFRKDTEQAHIAIGSKGLPAGHPDRFALYIMDNILGGSMSSRLFQKIREELGLVYSIYSFSSMFTGMGMVGIYCGTHPDKAQEVLEMITDELIDIKKKGFDSKELERSKNHIKGTLLISSENSASTMNRIAKSEIQSDEYLSIDEVSERIEKVTLDDIYRVYDATWGSRSASLAVVGPVDDGELCLSDEI
ncbi:MAG: insulinase family protein [Actinobacteria bacterium]|nr:insulinase family protein [Actinomycetota bacterium]